MRVFREALDTLRPVSPGDRVWVYVPYDQLTDEVGPLARTPAEKLGIVLIENPAKAARRPYHKQKLALVLSSQRHFALEQAHRGVAVRYEVGPYAEVLRRVAEEVGPLTVMRPAEYELRAELGPLFAEGLLSEVPHEGWLTSAEEFRAGCGDPPWRMDAFYRRVRQRTGILMDDRGKPVGGRYSFDGENRKRWPGTPTPPELPRFAVDEVTQEVGELIETQFGSHPGRLDLPAIPAARADVERLWAWARDVCLPTFGPFEDAMSVEARNLWHTRISSVMNLLRLTPERVVREAADCDLPLASQEGFIRQVLGWREFVRHVHEATNGLRDVPQNVLEATEDLPAAFWGTPSGLACLDHVVESVWDEGYSHHITRLMILSNLGTLLGVDPRQLTDWFWVAYVDAFDWVVEPNVLGMGTFALGELMTTKPYVSGSAYIHKMSDYCASCAFHPKKTCPITHLYWSFLARNAGRLTGNFRMSMPLRSLAKRSPEKRARDEEVTRITLEALRAGRLLEPADFV